MRQPRFGDWPTAFARHKLYSSPRSSASPIICGHNHVVGRNSLYLPVRIPRPLVVLCEHYAPWVFSRRQRPVSFHLPPWGNCFEATSPVLIMRVCCFSPDRCGGIVGRSCLRLSEPALTQASVCWGCNCSTTTWLILKSPKFTTMRCGLFQRIIQKQSWTIFILGRVKSSSTSVGDRARYFPQSLG